VAPAPTDRLFPRARRCSRGNFFQAAVRIGRRRSGSRGRVGFGAAARSLAAGRRGGAGDRRRPFGPDLGLIWVEMGRLGSAQRRDSLEVAEVRRWY
jgi:hypothetical protein